MRGLSREQSLTANRSRRLSLNRDRNPSRSSLSSSSVSVDVENGIKLNASTLRKRKRGSTEENCQNHTHKQNVQGQKSLTDAQKRIRKAFGTIDMQSQEGQAVLHASSRNEDLIDHNARLERDRLFDLYEKKEHLVEVMEKVRVHVHVRARVRLICTS